MQKREREKNIEERSKVLNNILEQRNKKFRINYVRVWKNNNELEGYSLVSKEKNCSPTVYIDEKIWLLSDNEMIDYLEEVYTKNARQISVDEYVTKEYILENILPKVVSNKNKEQIKEKDIAYKEYLDLIVVFAVTVKEMKINNNDYASIRITNKILENADISIEEALTASVRNIEEISVVSSMEAVLAELSLIEPPVENLLPMYVGTVQSKINGASVILSEKILCEIGKILGNEYVILPSSVHEIIAVPYGRDDLLDMVKEVNETQVLPGDVLTDTVYCVDSGKVSILYK